MGPQYPVRCGMVCKNLRITLTILMPLWAFGVATVLTVGEAQGSGDFSRQQFLSLLRERYGWENREGYPMAYLDRFREDPGVATLLTRLPALGYRFDPEDYPSLSRLARALQRDTDLEKRLFGLQTMRFLQEAARSSCLPGFRFRPDQAEGLASLAEEDGILNLVERLCTDFGIPLSLADAEELVRLKHHAGILELLDTLNDLGYRSPGLPYLAAPPITFLGQTVRAKELHSLLPAYGEVRSRLRLPTPQNNDLLIDLYAMSYRGGAQHGCGLNLADALVQNGERVDLKDLYLLDRICREGQESAALNRPEVVRANLRQRLQGLAHIKREAMEYDESSAQLDRLPAVKLLKVSLVLDALADPAFRKGIWQLIEQDLADSQAEIGGVVNWQKGRLILEVVPSQQTDNLRYAPPERYRYDTRLARFHLHAVEKSDAAAAGPSLLDFYRAAQYRLDELVLTHLGEGTFNVDMVVSLGTRGQRVTEEVAALDLGIYSVKP